MMSKKNRYNHTDTPYKMLRYIPTEDEDEVNYQYKCDILNLQYHINKYSDNVFYDDKNSVSKICGDLCFFDDEIAYSIGYDSKLQVILDNADKI